MNNYERPDKSINMNKLNYYDNIAQIYDQTSWLTESAAESVSECIIDLVSATPETSLGQAHLKLSH